ncbi:MAG TPA: tetratricopeptide repeat protein [Thermoanaerobaculia bacterium]|nr:tetratricopeptide repeat protein [Thermoanaerobaculia bacterium]
MRACLASPVVVLACCLLGAVPVGAELPSAKDPWIAVESANFELLSNADARKTIEIAQRLERFRQVLALLKPGLKLTSPLPTSILVFKSDRSFAPYKRSDGQPHEDLVGRFITDRWGNIIALNAYPPLGSGFEVVFHEYVHFFARHNFPRLPLWANEGLAEYYSSFSEVGSDLVIGAAIPRHISTLRRREFIPFERLFTIAPSSPEYNEGDKKGIFYAQSWALMHYLMSGPEERRRAAGEFLRRLSDGEPPAEATRLSLGLSLAELDARLRGYVNGRQFESMELRAALLEPLSEPTVTPVSRARALAALGDLAARSSELAGQLSSLAEEHFRAALAEEPGSAEARAGLGRLARQAGREAEAERLLAEAVALGSTSPVPYLVYADLLLERADQARSRGSEGGASSEVLTARKALERALELAPDFGEVHLLLGLSYFGEGTAGRPGIPHLERAAALLPERGDVVFNLAMLQLNAGEIESARMVVEKWLSRFDRPDLLAQAREAVTRAHWVEEARKANEAGRLDEAIAAWRQAVEATTDPAERSRLTERLADFELQVRISRDVEVYNRAVALVNRGQLEEALAVLDELGQRVADADLSDAVRSLRDELRAALREEP